MASPLTPSSTPSDQYYKPINDPKEGKKEDPADSSQSDADSEHDSPSGLQESKTKDTPSIFEYHGDLELFGLGEHRFNPAIREQLLRDTRSESPSDARPDSPSNNIRPESPSDKAPASPSVLSYPDSEEVEIIHNEGYEEEEIHNEGYEEEEAVGEEALKEDFSAMQIEGDEKLDSTASKSLDSLSESLKAGKKVLKKHVTVAGEAGKLTYDQTLTIAEQFAHGVEAIPILGITLISAFVLKNTKELKECLEERGEIKELKEEILKNPLYDSRIDISDLPNGFKGENGLRNMEASTSPMLTRLAKTMQYAGGKLEDKIVKTKIDIVGGLTEIAGAGVVLGTGASGIGGVVGAGVFFTGFAVANLPLAHRIGKCAYKTLAGTRGVNRGDHANYLYGLALHGLAAQGKVDLNALRGENPKVNAALEFMENLRPPLDPSSPDFKQATTYAMYHLDNLELANFETEKGLNKFLTNGYKKIFDSMKSIA